MSPLRDGLFSTITDCGLYYFIKNVSLIVSILSTLEVQTSNAGVKSIFDSNVEK